MSIYKGFDIFQIYDDLCKEQQNTELKGASQAPSENIKTKPREDILPEEKEEELPGEKEELPPDKEEDI